MSAFSDFGLLLIGCNCEISSTGGRLVTKLLCDSEWDGAATGKNDKSGEGERF